MFYRQGLRWLERASAAVDLRQAGKLLGQERAGGVHAANECVERTELRLVLRLDDGKVVVERASLRVDVLDGGVRAIRAGGDDAVRGGQLGERLIELRCESLAETDAPSGAGGAAVDLKLEPFDGRADRAGKELTRAQAGNAADRAGDIEARCDGRGSTKQGCLRAAACRHAGHRTIARRGDAEHAGVGGYRDAGAVGRDGAGPVDVRLHFGRQSARARIRARRDGDGRRYAIDGNGQLVVDARGYGKSGGSRTDNLSLRRDLGDIQRV